MSARRRVLVTGATGTIGRLLVDRLAGDYDLVQHGRTPRTPEQEGELKRADLTSHADVAPLMDGVDTVLHLAGVRRVVYASSNHAMGMRDRHGEWPVYPHHLPRPDSLYGVSKVFGETLGRFYHDEHGLDVISLRIGWSSGDPTLADEELLRAMWLSDDDTEQVFRCAGRVLTPRPLPGRLCHDRSHEPCADPSRRRCRRVPRHDPRLRRPLGGAHRRPQPPRALSR